MYQYLDAAVVRAPAWQPGRRGTPWPELTGQDDAPSSWREWLDLVWQIPEFCYAVEFASPDLANRVSQILSGRDVADAAVHRAVLSTLRYLLRASGRATPFGLFAGIAPARIGGVPVMRAGTAHRARARASGEWPAGVIERLQADVITQPHLTVIASDLAAERDGHLVIEHRPGPGDGPPVHARVRATRPVLAALDAARSPIRVADLAAKLAASFPAVPLPELPHPLLVERPVDGASLIALAMSPHPQREPGPRQRPRRNGAKLSWPATGDTSL